MTKIVREDKGNQMALVTITVEKNDYEPKFLEKLKNIKKKKSFRGFRKGKTPMNFLKKMFGRKILADVINDIVKNKLEEELERENARYLGTPLLTNEEKALKYDPFDLKDYEFQFDIGIVPEFEVKEPEEPMDFYVVEVPEEKVNEAIEALRISKGKYILVEDDIREEDIIRLNAKELENGQVKENGWQTTFPVLVKDIHEDIRKEVLSKKKGDIIRFNIFQLEDNMPREMVKKHLLHFTEADLEEGTETNEEYEAVIEEVKRLVPAELTPELLREILNEDGDKATEEELRIRIRRLLGKDDLAKSNRILFYQLRDKLIELNQDNIPLPEEYLKNMVAQQHNENTPVILAHFDQYLKQTRWNLIQDALMDKYDLYVHEEEIRRAIHYKIVKILGDRFRPDMEDHVQKMVNKTMKEPDQVENYYEEVLTNKIFFRLKPNLRLNKIPVSKKELDEKHYAAQPKLKHQQAVLSEEEE